MEQENKKEYPMATLAEYGYKEHKFLEILQKIVFKLVVILAVIMLYLAIFIIAIQSFNATKSTTEWAGFTFKWYKEMFSEALLTESIKNTFIVSIAATIISTIVGTLIAIGLHYMPKKVRSRIELLNNIPLLNADIVTGVSIMLLFSLILPLFPYIFGPFTIIIAHVFFTLPYVIINVLPKLDDMDPNMLDASMDLGIKPWKAIIKVIAPAVMGGIFSGLILSFTVSFEDFVVSYFTTGNGFDTMSIWIYSSIGKKSLFPGVYAFNTLLTFITILIVCGYAIIVERKEKRRAKKNN